MLANFYFYSKIVEYQKFCYTLVFIQLIQKDDDNTILVFYNVNHKEKTYHTKLLQITSGFRVNSIRKIKETGNLNYFTHHFLFIECNRIEINFFYKLKY